MWRRVGSNALANLSAGVSGTLLQIGLTAIATRSFGKEGFAVWAVALSMAALVPLFAANLSTIVTRRIVESLPDQAAAIMRSGHQLARGLSAVSVFGILLCSVILQRYSQPLQDMAASSFGLLMALLVMAQLWQILLQPRFGWHYAHESNWQVARSIACTRLAGLAGFGLLCWLQPGQLVLAALGLLLGTTLGVALCRNTEPVICKAPEDEVHDELAVMRPLLKAFAIWSVGSAVIQYGLPAIMSLLAPAQFTPFYLAYTLNLIVIGTVGTAASAMLAPLTRQRLAGHTAALERLMAWAPLATGLLLVVLMLAIWHLLPSLLTVWSADIASAEEVRLPLFWLAIQTIARSMTLIYSVLLSSAGRAQQMSRPILLELGLTCMAALPFGWAWGPSAFLAALAAAGILTALYTVWTTLNLGICAATSRIRLGLAFVGSQALSLGIWTLASQ
ncbi:hypothetical protein OOZ63_25245 [Paucibacter sp. PLA-PC-4]|uniref:lipopolysaccharide biosynthesis protein n=1 Tax=Paucibacter sp. PLA-PC-4 TaxID=2993655 RepID=UPI00224A4F73|nr:hypothetical protein [Paucibacter sp. PLA-PC-4]MCX2865139.1 hypothetical protein [Paucibacter sp. PLA-PC-4]